MNGVQRFLFDLLLLAYPGDFRDEYRAQILDHLEREPAGFSRVALDIVATGLGMRMSSLLGDARFALRGFRQLPFFTIVVVGTLAIAIGANAIVFTLLNAVLLKPLPFAQPSRLAIAYAPPPKGMPSKHATQPIASSIVHALERDPAFAGVAASWSTDAQLRGPGGSVSAVHEVGVTPNYFSTLGVRPEIGRLFDARTDRHARVAVISDALWRRRFGADAGALGRIITLGKKSYTIVGVAPAGMRDPGLGTLVRSDLWIPLARGGGNMVVRYTIARGKSTSKSTHEYLFYPILRLRPGFSVAAAQAEVERVAANDRRLPPGFQMGRIHVVPLFAAIFGSSVSLLWIIFGAVCGVLLIACANVANLLLARGTARSTELAIRAALGAKRRQIVQQLLVETLLLAAFGAALGIGFAYVALPAAIANMPVNLPRVGSAHIDAAVVLYVAALVVAVTLLAGLVPSFSHAARARGGLRPTGRGDTDTGAGLRAALVVAEIAVAFTLVICAGLLLRSFWTLTHVDLGFQPQNRYAVAFFGGSPGESNPQLAQRALRHIRRLPEVKNAAIATVIPFSSTFMMMDEVVPPGHAMPRGAAAAADTIQTDAISPGYLALMNIPVLAGRAFSPSDGVAGNVALINESLARRDFPHGNAVGKSLSMGGSYGLEPLRIVGVVADTRSSLTQPPQPILYTPYNGSQMPFFQIALQTRGAAGKLAQDVRQTFRALHITQRVQIVSLSDRITKSEARTSTGLQLLGTLAVIALLLALAGIYGVVSYGTQRRYHEIGVRMALGARPVLVLRRIVAGALAQGFLGIALGLILAGSLTRLLQDRLFETSPLDPATFAAVVVLLVGCAALAALIPAWRAARIDPAITLRYE